MNHSNSTLDKIGGRILELRTKKQLTQQELAQRLNVRREIVNYWENGNRDIKTGNLVLLAQELDTTCDYLLRGIESQNNDINKETGLCNEAINIIKMFPSSSPYIESLNSILTNNEIFSFLTAYHIFSSNVCALSLDILEFFNTLKEKNMPQPENIINFAYDVINDIDNPLYDDEIFSKAHDIYAANEDLDYYMYKLNNSIKVIAEEYKKEVLNEITQRQR